MTSPRSAETSAPPSPAGPVLALSRAQADEVLDLDQWAFGMDVSDRDPAPVIASLPWDRMFGIRDGHGALIACGAALELSLPVPGAELPCAGLTWIGVHPQERRRGRLTALIRHHLDDVRGREPVSALWAAEPAIYGRFGYGAATRQLSLTVPRGAGLREVSGAADLQVRMERLQPERHEELVAGCYDSARGGVPGWVSRPRGHLDLITAMDTPARRDEAESLRIMIVTAGDDVRGYALFRRQIVWTHGVADGTVRVMECVARDPAAARALWSRLTDLDLTARVQAHDLALDDPLVLLGDVRTMSAQVSDGLWVRLVDLPGALAGRRYACPVDVVFEVSDAFCAWNAGRWRLRADDVSVSCQATDRDADVFLDVRDLASAYLGGQTLVGLARAGLVTCREPAVLAVASVAFASPVTPSCPWTF